LKKKSLIKFKSTLKKLWPSLKDFRASDREHEEHIVIKINADINHSMIWTVTFVRTYVGATVIKLAFTIRLPILLLKQKMHSLASPSRAFRIFKSAFAPHFQTGANTSSMT
jgi:hypothetical protein